jgi:hypothetical protein
LIFFTFQALPYYRQDHFLRRFQYLAHFCKLTMPTPSILIMGEVRTGWAAIVAGKPWSICTLINSKSDGDLGSLATWIPRIDRYCEGFREAFRYLGGVEGLIGKAQRKISAA